MFLGQSTTTPIQPAIQEMADNLKNLIWMIIIIALIVLLFMWFSHA